jgi:hypothetical protein
MRSDARGRAALQHCTGVLQSARLSSLEASQRAGGQADGSILDRIHYGTKSHSAGPTPPPGTRNGFSRPELLIAVSRTWNRTPPRTLPPVVRHTPHRVVITVHD